MKPSPSILIIGKRGAGKSWVVRDLMHSLRDIECGVVIDPKGEMDDFYEQFFPNLYVHDKTSTFLLENILIRQREIKQRNKSDPRAVLVMDNCISSRKELDDHRIKEIVFNGRCYCLSFILTISDALLLDPATRANFDYVVLLAEGSSICRKKLWQDYASGIFETFELFEHIFMKCTENYGAMVIDNSAQKYNIDEKVFWYRASERKFMFGYDPCSRSFSDDGLGCERFRRLHKGTYDPNFDPDVEDVDGFHCFAKTEKIKRSFDPITKSNNEEEVDKIFDSFINEDSDINYESLDPISEEETHSNDPIVDKAPWEHPLRGESIQFTYNDPTYKFSANITNLQNHQLIQILCDHVECLKAMNTPK